MFNIVRKAKFEIPKINMKSRINLMKNNIKIHPIKVAQFSSLKKNLTSSGGVLHIEGGEEIKINYNIEDTRSFDGLLISLTSIGNNFIYMIYIPKN